MKATILTQGSAQASVESVGREMTYQDPDTGEIVRNWVEDFDVNEPGVQSKEVPCMVRGVIDGGIRVAGTTERWNGGGIYENVDFAKMAFPPNTIITKRDKITKVTGPDGNVIWKEEESDSSATVFDVLGVTPVIDPFGTHVENFALLQRSEVQQHG